MHHRTYCGGHPHGASLEADRFGPRAVAVPGALLFGAGSLLLLLRTGAEAQYWTDFFPAAAVGGTGIGLALPAFGSAAVAELPRARFATGIAIASCFRQIGAVLGVAGLVAVIGTPAPGGAVDAFHQAWALVAASGLAAAVIATALGRVRARDVERPTPGAGVGGPLPAPEPVTGPASP